MKAINRKGQNRKRTSGGGKIFEHVEFHMIKGIHVAMQNYNSESHCPTQHEQNLLVTGLENKTMFFLDS